MEQLRELLALKAAIAAGVYQTVAGPAPA